MSETLQQPQQNKGMIKISLVAILALFYMAHKVMPIVGFYTPAVVRMGMCGLLLLLLMPLFQRKVAWVMFGLLSVSGLALILRMIRGRELILYTYGEIQIYLYGLITLWFVAKEDKKLLRNVLWFILAMYIVTAITTIVGNDKYPQASRLLASLSNSDAEYTLYVKNNIGNFSFAYELVLITPILICMIKQKIINSIIAVGVLLLIAACLLSMEYGMALILFFVAVSLLVLPRLTIKRLMIFLTVFLAFFLLFGESVAKLFESLSKMIESETLSERFLLVSQALSGKGEITVETGANRAKLYEQSLQVFFDTGFIGGWGKARSGGHSFILDALANYGVLGAAAVAVVCVTIYRITLKPYKKESFYPYILASFLLMLVMMVMNPKIYLFVFLTVIPLFGEWRKHVNHADSAEKFKE